MAYGKLKVDRIETTAEELVLPTSAGSFGQVLTSDGAGVLSFMSNQANTDLSVVANGSGITIESSSGNNAVFPAASLTAWGAMSDEDKSKLDLIEPLATADQTDADHTKLDGIETSATEDQTGAEIKTAYKAE